MERLQSQILLTASSYITKYMLISSYIREPFLCNRSYLNFFINEEKFIFFLTMHLSFLVNRQICNGDSEKSSAQAHMRNI
jgi:hypothetical protein